MTSRNEKIGLASLGVAVLSCALAALTVREVRVMLGLPVESAVQAAQADAQPSYFAPPERAPVTPTEPARVPPADPAPSRRATPSQPRVPAEAPLHAARATASSILPPSRVAGYGPEMAVDGSGTTPWVEGVPGYGVGEWIQLDFGDTRTVTGLRIRNGYDKGARFRENGRIRGVTARFSNGETRTFSLADHAAEQTIDIGGVPTTSLRLTINSVYEGARWDDTALGDLVVIGH